MTRVNEHIWTIMVRAPDGSQDQGTITLLSIEMSAQDLASRAGDIAWRLTMDLAMEVERKNAGAESPGDLVREKISDE